MVLGHRSLSHFVQGRMEVKDIRYKSQSKRQYTLEEEHKVISQKLDIDSYEIVPVPKGAR